MAEFYKILKADPMGEPYTPSQPGAKPIQSYWCQVEGQEWAVMIGKQVGNTLTPGEHVYGNLMYAKSQKGNEYWKFKSEKVPEGTVRPADTPAQAVAQQATGVDMSAKMPDWFQVWANVIQDTHKMVKELHGGFAEDEPKEEPKETKGVEQIAGEPVDEETKDMLDGIFGEPEVDAEPPVEA